MQQITNEIVIRERRDYQIAIVEEDGGVAETKVEVLVRERGDEWERRSKGSRDDLTIVMG